MFSASQIATAELCERKWGWTYLENIRLPPPPAAAKGVELHTYLEESIGTRFWNLSDPIYPLVAPARKLLEAVPLDAEIEYYFELKLGPGSAGTWHDFRGYIDLTWLEHATPVVWDHKSTGNLAWAKNPEDLLKDPQATLYAKAAWDKYYLGEPGAVDLRWQYYRTKDAPAIKTTRLRVLPGDVEPRLRKTIQTADKLQAAIDAGKRAGDMPPNWDACFAFGGCPFREHCEQEEQAKGTGIKVSERKASLLAMINSKISGGTKPEPTPEPAPDASRFPETAVTVGINPPDDTNTAHETGLRRAAAINPPPDDDPAPPTVAEKPTEKPTEPAPKPPTTRRRKTILYVNCLPTAGAKMPVNASTLFEKTRVKVDAPHYKLIEFGKGAGVFAAALREVIDADGGLPDAVYLWTGTNEGRDAFEVLASFSDVVVQGLPG